MRERVKSHLFSTFFAPITFELRFRSVSIGILAILPVRILYASAIDEAGAWDNYSTQAIFSHLIDLFAILQAAIVQHVLNGKFTYQNTTLLLPHKTQIQMAFQWSVQIDGFAYSTWSWAFHNANFILCCFFSSLCDHPKWEETNTQRRNERDWRRAKRTKHEKMWEMNAHRMQLLSRQKLALFA